MDAGKEFISDRKTDIFLIMMITLLGIFLIYFSSVQGGKLLGIRALSIDHGGNVYVIANYTLYKLDPAGNILFATGSEGGEKGQFGQAVPLDIATDKRGNIYVADVLNNRVEMFDPNGSFVSCFGSPGLEEGKLDNDFQLAVDDSGSVYIAESQFKRVQKFDPQGKFVYSRGGVISKDFEFPLSPIVARSGDIYVCEFWKARVQSLSPQGRFLREYALLEPGKAPDKQQLGLPRYPQRIAQDSSGDFYVLSYDAGFSQGYICKYSPDFKLITTFTSPDTLFPLSFSAELACSPGDVLFIATADSPYIEMIDTQGSYVGRFGSDAFKKKVLWIERARGGYANLRLAGQAIAALGLALTLMLYYAYKRAIKKAVKPSRFIQRVN